jgi:rhodanese-related sulfurtransferase
MSKKVVVFFLCAGLAVIWAASAAWAASFKDLTAQELKTKLDSGETVVLVNPLSDLEFNEGHVPGSINIPLHLIPNTDQLPSDKTTPIVTYCLGPK